jgi:hypothetical protein
MFSNERKPWGIEKLLADFLNSRRLNHADRLDRLQITSLAFFLINRQLKAYKTIFLWRIHKKFPQNVEIVENCLDFKGKPLVIRLVGSLINETHAH